MKEYVFYLKIPSVEYEKREEFAFPDNYLDEEIHRAYEKWLWENLKIDTAGYWRKENEE